MAFTLRRLSILNIASVILLFLSISSVIAWKARSGFIFAKNTISASALPNAQAQKTPISVDYALITLSPAGFYPTEVARPSGTFLLAVDNRVGNNEVVLQLVNKSGARGNEKKLAKGQLRLRQLIDLAPGDYDLIEINHPDWVCHINISAK